VIISDFNGKTVLRSDNRKQKVTQVAVFYITAYTVQYSTICRLVKRTRSCNKILNLSCRQSPGGRWLYGRRGKLWVLLQGIDWSATAYHTLGSKGLSICSF